MAAKLGDCRKLDSRPEGSTSHQSAGTSVFLRQENETEEDGSVQDQVEQRAVAGQRSPDHISIPGDEGLDALSQTLRQSDNANSDDDLAWPSFSSMPTLSRSRTVALAPNEADTFVNTLYESVSTADAVVTEGVSARATTVGTVKEEPDHLTSTETDYTSGPAYDLQLLRRLMAVHEVPQRLPFLCLNAHEMRMQSHADCTPVVLIRFRPTQGAIVILSQ